MGESGRERVPTQLIDHTMVLMEGVGLRASQAAQSAGQLVELPAAVGEPSPAWALQFTDLAESVDVRRILYSVPFEGRFEILQGPPDRRGASLALHPQAEHVTVQFGTETAYRQVSFWLVDKSRVGLGRRVPSPRLSPFLVALSRSGARAAQVF